MSMMQRRKRAVANTWIAYLAIMDHRMRQGDSMPAFVWETFPMMLVATVVSAMTGRKHETALKWATQI